jgi:hypothetical protein
VFVLAFTAEVRVQASEVQAKKDEPAVEQPTDQHKTSLVETKRVSEPARLPLALEVTQEPAGCLKAKTVCAVMTGERERFSLKLQDHLVHLDQSTVLVRYSQDHLALVRGMVWVETHSSSHQKIAPLSVETEFGTARLRQAGEMWVQKLGRKAYVFASRNEVELMSRGSDETLTLEAGFQNFFTAVDGTGKAQVGVPTAILFHDHVQRWARHFAGGAKEFEKQLRVFHGAWLAATERASELHQQLYQRKVAAYEEEQAKIAEAKRREDARNRALREQLWNRVFDGFKF